MKKDLLSIGLLTLVCGSCKQSLHKSPVLSSSDITKVINQMTGIIIHDVTNPPLAARFFSYACLAGYEVITENNKGYKSMHGILNAYPVIKKNPDSQGYQLSAVIAMIDVAKKMQPSGTLLNKYEQAFLDSCKKAGFLDDVIDSSKKYADGISKQILAYAKKDNYNRISNYPRYTPIGNPGTWYPTPPAYMALVEPYFKTVRPFTLDSSSQFKPVAPVTFSTDKHSTFYADEF